MPQRMRQLLHQNIGETKRFVYGRDIGFNGMAANAPIADRYQRERLIRAATTDERLHVAYGYLRRVLKNGGRAAEERNDPEMVAALDDVRSQLIEAIIVMTERLKANMVDRGYDSRQCADPALALHTPDAVSSVVE